MVNLFRRLLILALIFVLTKKLFNKPNSFISHPIMTNSQDLRITSSSSPIIFKQIRPAITKQQREQQNEDTLAKIEKINAHIEELAYLLSLPENQIHIESMHNKIREIKKQADEFHVKNLINYPQLQEIESNIFIFKRSNS